MKAREPRRNVVMDSRLRCGADWQNACILNISSRGLGLQAPAPPQRGSYVEVRRGNNIIIARVVWVRGHRFGVRTQDTIPVNPDINLPKLSSGFEAQTDARKSEFRPKPMALSFSRQHDESRNKARALEFAALVALGVTCACLAFGMIQSAIGTPLSHVEVTLGG